MKKVGERAGQGRGLARWKEHSKIHPRTGAMFNLPCSISFPPLWWWCSWVHWCNTVKRKTSCDGINIFVCVFVDRHSWAIVEHHTKEMLRDTQLHPDRSCSVPYPLYRTSVNTSVFSGIVGRRGGNNRKAANCSRLHTLYEIWVFLKKHRTMKNSYCISSTLQARLGNVKFQNQERKCGWRGSLKPL